MTRARKMTDLDCDDTDTAVATPPDQGVIELPGKDAIVSQPERDGPARIDSVGENPFKKMGGSDYPSFNSVLLRQTIATCCCSAVSPQPDIAIAAASAALAGFAPADEIEGMLAGQAVAMHHGAMECFRRAMLPDQPAEIASKLRKDGANLARGVVDMVEALNRKRGKGPQVVRVERVVVHEGGQAVVGNVQAGGGGGIER